MITSPKFLNKPVLNMNIQDYSKFLNEAAKNSKECALQLMELGVRSEVTPKQARKLLRENGVVDMFDKSTGKLTDAGKKVMAEELEKEWLPAKATLGDYLENMLNYFH